MTPEQARAAAEEILSKFGKVHDHWAEVCAAIILKHAESDSQREATRPQPDVQEWLDRFENAAASADPRMELFHVISDFMRSEAPRPQPGRCPTCNSDSREMHWCAFIAHEKTPHAYIRHECVRCHDSWHVSEAGVPPTPDELNSPSDYARDADELLKQMDLLGYHELTDPERHNKRQQLLAAILAKVARRFPRPASPREKFEEVTKSLTGVEKARAEAYFDLGWNCGTQQAEAESALASPAPPASQILAEIAKLEQEWRMDQHEYAHIAISVLAQLHFRLTEAARVNRPPAPPPTPEWSVWLTQLERAAAAANPRHELSEVLARFSQALVNRPPEGKPEEK